MTALLTVSLLFNCVLGIAAYRLWRLYWPLHDRCGDAAAALRSTLNTMSRLSKRDILSNDPTVVAFVRHVAAAITIIETLATSVGAEDADDSTEEAQDPA